MAATPLNSLHAFVVVAKRLSYSSAARELGVSSSALSQSVRQLEQRLGVPLLMRTSRSVALTEAGERLLHAAGPAVEQALAALQVTSAQRDVVAGRLRLTVPSVAVSSLLIELLPRYIKQYPEVALEVHVDDRFVGSVAGGYDAGIRLVEAIERDMVCVRLSGPTRAIIAAAPSYLKRRGEPQKPKDLLEHECLCIRREPSGEPWAWELSRGKTNHRIPVRGPITSNDAGLLHQLALKGVGLLYTLEERVAADLKAGRLQPVLSDYAPKLPGLYLYYPSHAQSSPALQALVKMALTLRAPS